MLPRCAPSPFENLRAFLRFWVDERPNAACCLFADDDTLETDAQEFDCQACAVADTLDQLWPENRRIWVLSRQVFSRFLFDAGCVGVVLERVTRDLETEDVLDVLQRLSVVYDELYPPPEPAK